MPKPLCRITRALLAIAACGISSMPAHAQESLVVANVHVIDVRAGTASPLSDVKVENGVIVEIGPRRATAKPRSRVLDGRGGYLLPGFWDLHAHVNLPEYAERWLLPMMLASGVTGVRDMSGDCWPPGCADSIAFMRRLQERVKTGAVAGPRLLAISSAVIGGPRVAEEDTPVWANPRTSQQAVELVAQLRSRGVDLVKPYDSMTREAYFAMLGAARAVDLPVGGHVPMSVSTLEAVNAGQATIEHAKNPLIDCSRYGATFHEIYAAWAETASNRIFANWATPAGENLGSYYQRLLEAYDEPLCRSVISGMAKSPVGYVPTLITRRFEARTNDRSFLDDARLAHVPQPLREEWEADATRTRARLSKIPGEQRAYEEFYRLGSKLVGQAHRAGVRILVGTDSPDSYCFPGDGYHDELTELHAAGLPNEAILRAATLGAAEFLGRSGESGVIEVGKAADLVLLAGDPLQDISRTRHITAVISNGQVWDLPQLQKLRSDAEAFAAGYGRSTSLPSATP